MSTVAGVSSTPRGPVLVLPMDPVRAIHDERARRLVRRELPDGTDVRFGDLAADGIDVVVVPDDPIACAAAIERVVGPSSARAALCLPADVPLVRDLPSFLRGPALVVSPAVAEAAARLRLSGARERAIALQAMHGMTYAQIADRHGVSLGTVKRAMREVLTAIACESHATLLRRAVTFDRLGERDEPAHDDRRAPGV